MLAMNDARQALLGLAFGFGVSACLSGAEPTLETYGDGAAEEYGCIVGDLGCECAVGDQCDGALTCEQGMCVCNSPECMGPPPTTGMGSNGETSMGDGDGDGTSSETGDGDGDTGDGDGDTTATGDGDGDPPTTGDGDGDPPPTTGDGDGDPPPTTGDGDGDPTTTGDGDGDMMTTGDGDGDSTT